MTPAVCFLARGCSAVAMRKEASELRKSLKPLMEKRRRARINACLKRLKQLVVPLMGKDEFRYSKLEKADILELTVKFLADVPKTPSNDATVSYREGYEACLRRVSALLPRASLDRRARARAHDFVRQSLRSSSPACHACSARASGAPSPPQSERRLSRKRVQEVSRREKRAGVAPERDEDAPPAADQPVWRPW